MAWAKLNDCVEIWKKPVLGTEKQKDGKRYMALCLDPKSKNPYRGIARQIIDRKGSPDIPGFLDKSRLIIVESYDLLKWKIVGDLNIKGIEKVIKKLYNNQESKKEFLGLEDSDIVIDENRETHIYFTIPFKYRDGDWYDVYVGHAKGNELGQFTATMPVLGRVSRKITGFKEICLSPVIDKGGRLVLTETFIDKGKEKKYSAISVSKARNLSGKWEYMGLVHDPAKESRAWCRGHSSPCRIFDPEILSYKGNLVGIMNGREQNRKIKGVKYYGKFRPGLFLFDSSSGKIVWIDKEPLFEDPLAVTITFASELVPLNKKEAILYAHPNDSFVRAYKLNLEKIKERLP